MKKYLRLLLCVILCALSLALPLTTAFADLIYEPEDDFYNRHRDECTYEGRTYEILAPDGKAKLYQSPASKDVLAVAENGGQVFVNYVYTPEKGARWGTVIVKNENGYWVDAWIPMDYLWLTYDSQAFFADYSAEIYEEEAFLDIASIDASVVFYSFPGSTVIAREIEKEWLPESFSLTQLFRDDAGTWGYLPYLYGKVDGWVCLNNPSATPEELYPNGIPVRDTRLKQTVTEIIEPAQNGNLMAIAAVLVSGVVVSSAALLFLLKKRKANKTDAG